LKVASLGSGSRGNALYVEEGGTRVLVDAGFSGAQLARRLRALDVEPSTIDAVVVTHDHRDHTAGAGVAARRWGWPLFMSPTTRAACASLLRGREEVCLFEAGATFELGALSVTSFLTCHDAADPLAITLTGLETGLKLGVATDLGRPTTAVRHALSGCHFLVLEANHDEVLLRDGPYPWSIKERIGGSHGHLSNRLAADLAIELLHPGLCGILLAHLSQECNDPERARGVVFGALEARGWKGSLHVAEQDRPSPLFDLPRLLARTARGRQLDLFGAGRRS
jgi:phosphoribosyl 1,2-cyclic phosphodiesterase